MIDQAQRRLLLALGASVLLHVWLVQSASGPGARRASAERTAPLSATLRVPQRTATAPAGQARVVPPSPGKITAAAAAAAASRRGTVTAAVPAALAPPAVQATTHITAERITTTALASDPTYYAARSLDVYPRALTALDLGIQAEAGTVRATVMIDESGTVNDVRAIAASAAEIENAARELLLRTRFSPAGKDGRIVKAQLQVSLDYGPPAPR